MKEELKNDSEGPQSSELPLATIGTPTPLVIDLPDGQKLVVSNLDPGTVIEVATWRGTGRPDSRTNRLMLGVSSAADEPSESEQSPTKRLKRAKGSQPHLSAVTSEENPAESENSLSYTVTTTKNAHEEIQRRSTFKERLSIKGLVKGGAITLAILLILVGLVGPGKFRVAHPQSGVASSLGSAVNSLIIIRAGSSAKVGEAVIADFSDPIKSPVLAVVNAVENDNYLLATNSEQFQSTREKIHGKVLFVIPYLGFFATLINK